AQGAVQVLAYGLHLGARLPVHATSTGRVLLAAKTRTELAAWMKGRALPRLTAHTVTDLRRLRALVDEARQQDFCLASEEHELGVQALAVPLRNIQGQAVAALNVVVAPHRMTLATLQRDLLPVLLDAARELRPLL
ncbi:MAG: IclR family transcriptional regulator C-terminal domain-containing protein, partial [Rhodoferax sp.]